MDVKREPQFGKNLKSSRSTKFCVVIFKSAKNLYVPDRQVDFETDFFANKWALLSAPV